MIEKKEMYEHPKDVVTQVDHASDAVIRNDTMITADGNAWLPAIFTDWKQNILKNRWER